MATVASREGTIPMSDQDVCPSLANAEIVTIIVNDETGDGTGVLYKGVDNSGPVLFHYIGAGVALAKSVPFYFFGSITTGPSLYFAGADCTFDIYIK